MARTAFDHHQTQSAAAAIPWAATVTRPRTRRLKLGPIIRFSILTLASIVWCAPIAWMLMTSLKPESQIITYPPRWFPSDLGDLTLKNYADVLNIPRGVNLVRAFRISLIIATIGTILTVIVDVLAG